ncbi:hypothetical protein CTAYLR_002195 [Chrysophaeum taylorii]|uniref:Cyclic nucleotide-binding domain-containing protein n=1 Tax=Chrysophaeum taylorii TaxID=2483200 RepID=A0AAD7UNH6_9STRA|nr:hypothetical protein CTAYLR_002195 [Chrysophaeum taylorii]
MLMRKSPRAAFSRSLSRRSYRAIAQNHVSPQVEEVRTTEMTEIEPPFLGAVRCLEAIESTLDLVVWLARDVDDVKVLRKGAASLAEARLRCDVAVSALEDLAAEIEHASTHQVAITTDPGSPQSSDDDADAWRRPKLLNQSSTLSLQEASDCGIPTVIDINGGGEDVKQDNEDESSKLTHSEDGERRELCSCCRGLPMISSQHPFRISWDLLLAVLLIFLLLVEPLSFFWEGRATRIDSPLGAIGVFIDIYFIIDLALNFRTGYTVEDGLEIMDPRKCAVQYLRTWFVLDFASSVPPVVDLALRGIAKGLPEASSLKNAKLLKLGRVFKVVKVLRIGKIARFSDNRSAFSDFVEDFVSSSSSLLTMRVIFVCFCSLMLAHLLACFMKLTGDGWYEKYDPDGVCSDDDERSPADWDWRRQYLVSFYFAFSIMTTVGFGDITPESDVERIYAIIAMLLGVSFYSYIIATVSSMVTAADSKSAIYFDKMDQLSSWMRHYHFEASLRRRTRAFFKRFYAQRSAIDERTILENLAPKLQEDVSTYLLHDFVKQHPLFHELPEGVLWKVLLIVRTINFDAGAVVAARGQPSFGLHILLAGRGKAEYSIRDGPIRRKNRQKAKELGVEIVSMGPGNSFGELCLLGAETKSLVAVTTSVPCEFFLIQRDAFLDAFTNLPEVLKSIVDKKKQFVGKPIWKIYRDSQQLELDASTKLPKDRSRSRSQMLKERQESILALLEEDSSSPRNTDSAAVSDLRDDADADGDGSDFPRDSQFTHDSHFTHASS